MKNFTLLLMVLFGSFLATAQYNQLIVGANNNTAIFSAALSGNNPTELNTGASISFYHGVYHSGNSKVYIAWYYGVYSMDVDGSNLDTLYNYPQGGMGDGIDVDEVNGHIYFTNTQTDSIYRMDLNGGNLTPIYGGANTGFLGDVKVDPVNGHIYFGEWLLTNGIYRIDYNGTNEVTVLASPEGRNLYLDQPNGHIYYSSNGLRRCDLNGANDTLIVAGVGVAGIDIDFSTGTIYMSDSGIDGIVTCDLTGNNLQTLIQSTDIYFSGDPLESPHGPVLANGPLVNCTAADTPVLTGPSGTICDGDSITLTWTGNLNDNDYWLFFDDWYGTVDTVYSNSITVAAVAPGNEYDVYGSGGCLTNGGGTSTLVMVNPSYSTLVKQERICPGDSLLIFGQYESTSGVYTDSLQTVSGCDSLFHIELIVDPLLIDQQITPTQTDLCDSGVVTINMAASESGVKYYLRDDSNNQVVDGPITGDGSAIDFTTGMISTSTDYNVYGERPSYGAHFDTTGNYLTSSTGDPITMNDNNVTIEFWMKWNGITDNGFSNGVKTLLVNGHEGSGGYSLRMLGSDSTLYVLFGGVGYLYTDYKVIPDTWTHIAVTGTSSNVWTYYVNGDSIASTVINNNPPYSWHKFNIGADYFGTAPFDGTIDDVRIWETVRTEAEIEQDMNTCMTGNETDLVAYFSFEHGITNLGSNGVHLEEVEYTGSPWTAGVDHCSLMCGTEMSTISTVTVTDIDPTVSVSGVTLMANQSGATYQWLDCNNGYAPIAGETGQSFTATVNGSYAVEVTLNGCIDTTSCENITTIGITENTLDMSILIYPNPNAGKFYVELSGSTSEMFVVEMRNNLGQIVYAGEMESNSSHLIELTDIAPGIYMVRIGNERRESHERIIVK